MLHTKHNWKCFQMHLIVFITNITIFQKIKALEVFFIPPKDFIRKSDSKKWVQPFFKHSTISYTIHK